MPHHSLDIARTVSAALVETVREVVAVLRPAFVLAKGGITSSDTATEGLGVRRAWSRGTMLPGIVSLWEPVSGPAQGIPYIVFPGNVGDDAALADVVADPAQRLTPPRSTPIKERRVTDDDRLHIAVVGLGAMGLPMATRLATAFTVTGFEPYAPRRAEAEAGRAAGGRHTGARPAGTPTSPCSRSGTRLRRRTPCSATGASSAPCGLERPSSSPARWGRRSPVTSRERVSSAGYVARRRPGERGSCAGRAGRPAHRRRRR